MRKTYQLQIEGKNRDRLLEAAKHDIRKYAKRERAKVLPKGVDFWDFDCKAGASDATAAEVHFAALMGATAPHSFTSRSWPNRATARPGRAWRAMMHTATFMTTPNKNAATSQVFSC